MMQSVARPSPSAGVPQKGFPVVQPSLGEEAAMLYELRQYRIKKGCMKKWVTLFEKEIVPFQVSHGMVVSASFTAVKDAGQFVWLRRFKNEAERVRLYKKVYESAHWKQVITPKVDALLDRSAIVVTQLVPTPLSVL
jgi:hypothetical protein